MCIIIDTNAVHEVFQISPSADRERSTGDLEAGRMVLNWLVKGKGSLAAEGKLLKEIEKSGPFARDWIDQLTLSGKLVNPDKIEVEAAEKRLIQNDACKSNDAHVIALAQVSGARLLYSKDRLLQQDFKNNALIKNGVVYPASRERKERQRILDTHLCIGA